MARQKKIFNYEFADGPREITSSYKVKCNATGELVPFYHKTLETLVIKKYKNNFGYFLKNFKKKGAEKLLRKEEGFDDKYALNAYSDYLIISYKSCLKKLEDNFNQDSIKKTNIEMDHIVYCFKKNFNRDITKFV